MGTAAQHLKKAEHNVRFLLTISDDYADWLATAAFYAAVHYLEAMFAEQGIHSRDHEGRKAFVRRNYPSLKKAYNALYNAALDSRYESEEHSLPAGEVRQELIARRLRHIQSYVLSHSQFCRENAAIEPRTLDRDGP